MASRYEILEFLRIKGGKALLRDIRKALSKKGTDSVTQHVRSLEAYGFVKTRKIKVPTKKGTYLELVEVELAPKAYEILRKYNVESFYDLPFAKAREAWYIEVFGRGFIRFDKV